MHRALEIAREHPSVFASAGIHPQEAQQATPEALAKLTELAGDAQIVAIGEIGLDYYHLDNPDIPTQQAAFVAQMQIAAAARQADHPFTAGPPSWRSRRRSEVSGRRTPARICCN